MVIAGQRLSISASKVLIDFHPDLHPYRNKKGSSDHTSCPLPVTEVERISRALIMQFGSPMCRRPIDPVHLHRQFLQSSALSGSFAKTCGVLLSSECYALVGTGCSFYLFCGMMYL